MMTLELKPVGYAKPAPTLQTRQRLITAYALRTAAFEHREQTAEALIIMGKLRLFDEDEALEGLQTIGDIGEAVSALSATHAAPPPCDLTPDERRFLAKALRRIAWIGKPLSEVPDLAARLGLQMEYMAEDQRCSGR